MKIRAIDQILVKFIFIRRHFDTCNVLDWCNWHKHTTFLYLYTWIILWYLSYLVCRGWSHLVSYVLTHDVICQGIMGDISCPVFNSSHIRTRYEQFIGPLIWNELDWINVYLFPPYLPWTSSSLPTHPPLDSTVGEEGGWITKRGWYSFFFAHILSNFHNMVCELFYSNLTEKIQCSVTNIILSYFECNQSLSLIRKMNV